MVYALLMFTLILETNHYYTFITCTGSDESIYFLHISIQWIQVS